MSINNINNNLSYYPPTTNLQDKAQAEAQINSQAQFEGEAQEKQKDKIQKLADNPWVTLGSYAAIFVGLLFAAKGINKNIAKGNKSYLGKLGDLGDKVSKFVSTKYTKMKENKGFAKFTETLSKNAKNTGKKVNEFLMNNKYTSVIYNRAKESTAVNKMAAFMRSGIKGQYIGDIDDQIRNLSIVSRGKFTKNGKAFTPKGKINGEERELTKKSLNDLFKNKFGSKYADLDELQEKARGDNKAYKELISYLENVRDTFGLKGASYKRSIVDGSQIDLKKQQIHFYNETSDTWVHKDLKDMKWYQRAFYNVKGAIQKLSTANAHFDGIVYQNKIACGNSDYAKASESVSTIAKTKFGRGVQKMALYTTENFTNGTAGGLFSIGMQVMPLAMIASATIQADPEDRFKTFMEELFVDLGYFMLLPIPTSIINKLSGMKYIGWSADQIQQYRKTTKFINENANNLANKTAPALKLNAIKTLKVGSDYKDAIKFRKSIKADASKNVRWYDKPLQLVGNVFNMGRDRVKTCRFPIKENDGFVKAMGKKVVNDFSNLFTYTIPGWVGGVGRFTFAMFGIQPYIGKTLAIIPHALFGAPKHSAYSFTPEENPNASGFDPQTQKMEALLMEKLQKNPEVIQILQTNPQLGAQIEQNPMLLMTLIEEVETQKAKAKIAHLQSLSNYSQTNKIQNNENQASFGQNVKPTNNINEQDLKQNTISNSNEIKQAKRTYVPSPYPKEQKNTNETNEEYDRVMKKSDYAFSLAQQALR